MKVTRPFWVVIASACLITGFAMAMRQVLGLYLVPVTKELALGREPFSNALAVANLVLGFTGILFGAISDKYGARWSAMAGIVSMMIGFVLVATAWTSVNLLIAGVMFGIGSSGAGVSALAGAVARAAPAEKRTAAIASLGMATGIATFLGYPYVHLLMETLGWRSSLFAITVTLALTLPLAPFLGGRPQVASTAARQQTLREAFAEALSHRGFWLLTIGFFVCGFHVAFYSTHLPAFVQDQGLPGWVSVWSLMALGAVNILGTWLAGQSGRFFQKRQVLSGIYFGRFLLFVGLIYLPPTPVTIIATTALLGLFWLSTIPLTSSLVGTFFGTSWMSMLFGFAFLSHQLGSFLGLYMAGVLYDATHSYTTMWWVSAGLGLLACLIHLPIQERPVPRLLAAAE